MLTGESDEERTLDDSEDVSKEELSCKDMPEEELSKSAEQVWNDDSAAVHACHH